MSHVIAFRRPAERHSEKRASRGATLFVHIKRTNMIVHLAKPQGQRVTKMEKANRS